MKILHITESFSPTPETFTYNLIVGLDTRGCTNQVFTLDRVNEIERPYNRVYVVNPPKRLHPRRLYSRLKFRLGLINFQQFTYDLFFDNARKQAYEVINEFKPDLVHAQFGPMRVMISPITQKLNIPLIVSFHGYDVNRLSRSLRWKEHYRKLADNITALTSTSLFLCDKLVQLGFSKTKLHQIYMGVDLSSFPYNDPQNYFDGKTIYCLHVGRLTQKKSPILLVEAFVIARGALLPEIDLRLTIAGDGELSEALARKIEDLQLTHVVKLLGAVNHDKVKKLFQETHIYTQHCQTPPDGDVEGQGVTFVEASASGLPILATRHGGIPDVVIDGKTGYLSEEGDIKSMAENLIKLAQNPNLWTEFGLAGRQHVESNFTLEQQLEKTLKLYKHVIEQNKMSDQT